MSKKINLTTIKSVSSLAIGVLVTLVIGNEKALLFDTAYGIGDLKKEVEQITKLPSLSFN